MSGCLRGCFHAARSVPTYNLGCVFMKDVTIISKVVGRKEGDRPVTGGGSQAAVDLSAYLLKKTWDTAWELREKDGVPYLFGKLPVVLQSGMTSYVADEAVDLPGIYDGLPIDNQTLKWVETTDENGAVSRVLVTAGGGTGGGGGSVQYPLSWSGFSNDSWDGSVAKTIVIPSKLSDLDGDVIVFKEDGWGDAFRIKPYFAGSGDDNYLAIERSVGGQREEPFFNDCLKIRGMTGKIEHICTNETAIEITHPHAPFYNWCNGIKLLNPILDSGQYEQIQFGKETSLHNCGYIAYKHQWSEVDGTRSSFVTIGLNGVDEVLNVTGYRRVGINTSVPRHDLEVNGQIGVTNNMLLYGNGNGDIKSVYNNDGAITNIVGHDTAAIRHALKFYWGDESYEIGVIRGGGSDARGFGVTHGNNKLVFLLGLNYCDFLTQTNFRDKLFVEGLTEVQDAIFNKNIELKGVTNQSNIYSVWNEDSVLDSSYDDSNSIKHALKFDWWDDSYEIGAVRGGYIYSTGFGVTYGKNKLVWKVNRERMDVYGDLRIKNGLIRYNEAEGYFYIDGNLVLSGGLTAFADEGAGNQWIMDVNTIEEVVSDNPFKVYSAKVVSMIASNITNTKEVEDGVKEALDKLEIIEKGLSPISASSTISQLRDTLVSIRSNLIAYVRDTE